MSDVYVLGAARTPFGAFGGPMRDLSLPELGAIAAGAALARAGLEADAVDEMAMGVNFPGSDRSIARQTSLRVGMPDTRNSYTIDRACCSSLAAVTLAGRGLRSGDIGVALAGGAENLSKVPYFLDGARFGGRLGDLRLTDQLVITCPYTHIARAVQASDEAERHGISRTEQDEWALRSHQRAVAAREQGRFEDELVPVSVDTGRGRLTIEADESVRSDTSLERLARLEPVNGSSTVTAGNAPGLSTGASFAVLSASPAPAPDGSIARLVATAQVSGHPARIGSIPATAVSAVLERARLTLDDIDVIEINEAFAAVPLVATLVLADGDAKRLTAIRERTNINGGAVAIGHPTGATGVRLLMTAIASLRRRGGGRAVVAMCGGVGEGEAAVVEVTGSAGPT